MLVRETSERSDNLNWVKPIIINSCDFNLFDIEGYTHILTHKFDK